MKDRLSGVEYGPIRVNIDKPKRASHIEINVVSMPRGVPFMLRKVTPDIDAVDRTAQEIIDSVVAFMASRIDI